MTRYITHVRRHAIEVAAKDVLIKTAKNVDFQYLQTAIISSRYCQCEYREYRDFFFQNIRAGLRLPKGATPVQRYSRVISKISGQPRTYLEKTHGIFYTYGAADTPVNLRLTVVLAITNDQASSNKLGGIVGYSRESRTA